MSDKYVAIMVHEDVYEDAASVVNTLEQDGVDPEILRILRDLVDPLPEPDRNGVTPFVYYDPEQPISAERARLLAKALLDLDVKPAQHWAVLCGPPARDYLELPDVYGPFISIDDANEFLVPHRSTCDATAQAWRDDHDEADEAHDIEEMSLGHEDDG